MAIINELRNLGDAVRERTATTELLTMEQMADKIRNIPYPQTDTITITANGTYLPPTGIDGYREVDVNVPDPELEEITITENGTYLPDAFGFSEVDVNVQPTLESITITENGTYTPQENIDGYNEIIVNTPVPLDPVIQEIKITENGTYTATDGVDGYNPIIVNVPTGGGGGGDIEVEPIVLTDDCLRACSGKIASQYIKLFGDTITTNRITGAREMFHSYTNEVIPFDINMNDDTFREMASMFYKSNLKELPKINNAYPYTINSIFRYCSYLRNIPEDYFDNWNFNRLHTYSSANFGNTFADCYSLRKIPNYFLENMWGIQTSSLYNPYYTAFNYCYALDEVIGLGVQQANITNNLFASTFIYCYRLKDFTFLVNEDGTAKIANWKNQTIDLSMNVGYSMSIYNTNEILNYNSGITADKEVKDDATYQALKDDPDWFSTDINYSRYNHDSAVNTINSLPDTSAYGTNTIKFKGQAGAKTDGGAINTLTEAEIAVATAKGWTVSFS